jgi:hypothetical protein
MTREDVCTVCGLPRRSHCEWDEPGVDHDRTCTKMHHEFRSTKRGEAGLALERHKQQAAGPVC